VRHHLVQRIVRAYEDYKTQQNAQLSLGLEVKPVRPTPEPPRAQRSAEDAKPV